MSTSDSSDKLPATGIELAKALVGFQKIVPVIEKTQTARIPTKSGGEYSYKYADLADIWAAIRTPLATCGLAVTQFLVGGSDGFTGIETTVWHESGQTKTGIVDVPTDGKSAQEAGSLFTYYKRYALGAALGISTEEDDDGKSGNSAPAPVATTPKASPNKPASEKQLNLANSLLADAGYSDDAIRERLKKVKSSADASELIRHLKDAA